MCLRPPRPWQLRSRAHELRRDKVYDVGAVVADVAPKHRNTLMHDCDTILACLKEESRTVGQNKAKLREFRREGDLVPAENSDS